MLLRTTVPFSGKQLSFRTQLASYACPDVDDPEVMRVEVRFDVLAGAGLEYRIEITLSRDGFQYWIPGGDITVSQTTKATLFLSSPVVVKTGDSFSVYATRVDGNSEIVAGDVDFYEDTGTSALQAIAADLTTAIASIAALPTAVQIETEVAAQHGTGSYVGGAGMGPNSHTIDFDDDQGAPIVGVYLRITTDAAGLNPPIAWGLTDVNGNFTYNHSLASGTTVYVWAQKVGYSFAWPATELIP